MARHSIADLAGALTYLLKEERALLQQGKARETVALSVEKLRVLTELEACISTATAGTVTAEDVRSIGMIKTLARENGVHLDAVRHGVRALAERFEASGNGESVGAYDRCGNKMPFSGGSGQYSNKV